MAKNGDTVRTPHGEGKVIDSMKERSRTSFRVAGRGFTAWVEEAKVHVVAQDYYGGLENTIDPGEPYHVMDNSTTLPWDPTPQHHVDQFRQEQTILPGDHEIDRDDWLHPSDSVSGKHQKGGPKPGPSPDLFAKSAAYEEDPESYFGGTEREPDPANNPDSWGPSHFRSHEHHDPHGSVDDFLMPEDHTPHPDDQAVAHYIHQDPELAQFIGSDEEDHGYHHGSAGPAIDMGLASGGEPWPPQSGISAGEDAVPYGHQGNYRPAGLSARYAFVEDEEHPDNPITAFRRDPITFISHRGHAMSDDPDRLHARYAEYTDLVEVDPQMRKAAWDEVADKATRLRAEGRVRVIDAAPDRVYATVEGDHGTYETMLTKGGSRDGLAGGQLGTWHCGCEWGRWAFQRQANTVHDLCAHAYAAYLTQPNPRYAGVVDKFNKWTKDTGHANEIGAVNDYAQANDPDMGPEDFQSLYDHIGKNPEVAPERKYDVALGNDPEKAYKTADMLRTRPDHLVPRTREVPEGEDEKWLDVTKDDRKDTGPDDIVHFSSKELIASLHRESKGGEYLNDDGPEDEGGSGLGDLDWGNILPYAAGPVTGLMNQFKQPAADALATAPAGGAGAQFNAPPPADPPAGPPSATDAAAINPALPQGGVTPYGAPGHPDPRQTEQAPKGAPVGPTSGTPVITPAGGAPAGGAPAGPAADPKPLTGPGSQQHAQEGVSTGGFGGDGTWKKNDNQSAIGGGAYKVQGGDTLGDIATRSGYGVDELAQASGIKDKNMITPGQTINMPGWKPQAPAGASNTPVENAVKGVPQGPSGKNEDPAGKVPGLPGVTAPAMGVKPSTDAVNAANPMKSMSTGLGKLPDLTKTPKVGGQRWASDSVPGMLDELRDISDTPAADHLHHMDERNERVSELVEKLQDAGVDASQFVASLHYGGDDNPHDGDADFLGESHPPWKDEPYQGSGPDPKYYMGDSASYVDDHERPHFQDIDEGVGDIIKFNDSRSKPQQGPGHTASYADQLHYSGKDPGEGFENPQNIDDAAWGAGDPIDFAENEANELGVGGAMGMPTLSEEPHHHAAGYQNYQDKVAASPSARAAYGQSGGISRAGGGPRGEVRVDKGFRGHQTREFQAMAPPEDFGYDGGAEPESYATPDGGSDIVANFQRSGAADAVMATNSGHQSNDEIAGAAQAFLRTAGRKYSEEEMRGLETESHVHGARNMPTEDDLAGTHYLL